jgi:hypothetical protein
VAAGALIVSEPVYVPEAKPVIAAPIEIAVAPEPELGERVIHD